jgi:hypothetical protein
MGIIRQVQARSSAREPRAAASSAAKMVVTCARPRAQRKTVHVHQHWKSLHPGASRTGSAISTSTTRCNRRQCSNGSVLSTAAKSTQAQFPGRRVEVAYETLTCRVWELFRVGFSCLLGSFTFSFSLLLSSETLRHRETFDLSPNTSIQYINQNQLFALVFEGTERGVGRQSRQLPPTSQ